MIKKSFWTGYRAGSSAGWPIATCRAAHAQLFNVTNLWMRYNDMLFHVKPLWEPAPVLFSVEPNVECLDLLSLKARHNTFSRDFCRKTYCQYCLEAVIDGNMWLTSLLSSSVHPPKWLLMSRKLHPTTETVAGLSLNTNNWYVCRSWKMWPQCLIFNYLDCFSLFTWTLLFLHWFLWWSHARNMSPQML